MKWCWVGGENERESEEEEKNNQEGGGIEVKDRELEAGGWGIEEKRELEAVQKEKD